MMFPGMADPSLEIHTLLLRFGGATGVEVVVSWNGFLHKDWIIVVGSWCRWWVDLFFTPLDAFM